MIKTFLRYVAGRKITKHFAGFGQFFPAHGKYLTHLSHSEPWHTLCGEKPIRGITENHSVLCGECIYWYNNEITKNPSGSSRHNGWGLPAN